jgi:HEAT repeat protein
VAAPLVARLGRALDLREGESRTLAVMGGFLLLNTATTTILSAAKNGLFLAAYPPGLIPYAVILAALLTALVAVLFTGLVVGTVRRRLAVALTSGLALSIVASRTLYELDPRSAFVLYLWLSAVQVLVLTHAWDYAGSLLTGRQAKRLLPLIGLGASIGAILGGTAVAPAALRLGTSNLLWIAVALTMSALPLLWLIDEPPRETDEVSAHRSGVRAFLNRAGRGMRSVGQSKLLRLLALGLIGLTLTGTLIDLQLKFLLQESFSRDRITAIYGLLSASVGLGTLVLQLWAAKVLFPRFGVSFAAMLHSATLVLAAGGAAVFGGLAALVIAQAVDDILQFSLQKPVEQVSLLPFPTRIKSVAIATLGGVLRPLSKASAGGIALAFAGQPAVLPLATVASATLAVGAYSRHRRRYVAALEAALTRHAVDFSETDFMPLVVDAGTISIIDKGLEDDDPGVVIFSASLLEQLPAEQAIPRLIGLLSHEEPDVRAEAAMAFARIEDPLDFAAGISLARRFAEEDVPYVLAAILDTLGRVGGVDPVHVERFLRHKDEDVRRSALVALGRLGWKSIEIRLHGMLGSPDVVERTIAARCVGDLRMTALMDELADGLSDPDVRASALESLAKLGAPAVPLMAELLDRRDLPLPLRRSVVTALSWVEGSEAKDALVAHIDEPMLGAAVLTSLSRMRAAGRIRPIDAGRVRPILLCEMQRGLRLAAVASVIRSRAANPRESFIAAELHGLQERSVHRVLKILALSYDWSRIDSIASALVSDNPARRSNALELLEGTISSATAVAVMPYMDVVGEGMPLHRVLEILDDPGDLQTDPAAALAREDEWWPRALGLHLLHRDDEISTPGHSLHRTGQEYHVIPLIEKVMLLKGSEFFKNFPGTDLAGVAAKAGVVHVEAGEVIFEQGDEGDAFYLVVKGAVIISRGATKLATLGPREGFGEMAILDRDTRSATATAGEDTTLLSLDRDEFDQIVEQNPVVARGVYRVLTERLRNTLAQVAAG